MDQLADMIYPRASHGICINNRFIYVCAGKSETETPQKTFERYDTSLNSWERLPDCLVAAQRPLLVTLNEKYIFKLGGILADDHRSSTIERFDIAKKEWSMIDFIIKEEGKTLKSTGFGFLPMMTGVQISYNSLLVEYYD